MTDSTSHAPLPADSHVVITGGAGLIGSHMVEACLQRGHRVTIVDNFVTGSPDNIQHVVGRDDVALVEQDACEGLGVDGPIDAILHLASPASPMDFDRLPLEILHAGSRATEVVLRAAEATGARMLLASTSEVYGDPAISPQPETYWGNVNTIGPRSAYDEAKRYAEALTMVYRRTRGVHTTIGRIFNTYGPRMRLDDGRVLPAFVTAALRGEPLQVHGDGKQTRSFCFVEDTVAGLLAVLDHSDGLPVNVGAPGEMSILDFAHLVIEVAGSTSELIHTKANVDDPKRREPLIDRAKALGWTPQVALREGLERTVAWFREAVASAAGAS